MRLGTDAFAAEQDQEIEILKTKAAKVDELNAKNDRLAAELGAIREYQQRRLVTDAQAHVGNSREKDDVSSNERGIAMVPIEEYRRVKDELESSERDYGKLVGAHNILQSKVRYYKDMTKQWREYTKRWVSKDATKRANRISTLTPKQTSPVSAEEQKSPNAPTPPAFPSGITPSVSDYSRSTSPQQQGSVDWNPPHLDRLGAMEQGKSMEALENDIVATQSAMSPVPRTDVGDSTQASDDSDWIPRSTDRTKTLRMRDANHDNGSSLRPAEHNGGSSPVVVFERPVKRKRPSRSHEDEIHVHEDNYPHTTGISGRQAPKNEQHSSSPASAGPSLPVAGVHDSLDLDDVGDHLLTPRKRQRMERNRMRSSNLAPLAANLDDRAIPDDMLDDVMGRENEVSLQLMKHEDGHKASSKDPISYTKAAKDQGRLDEPKENRADKYAKRAQFQAHNDRVVGRIELKQQDPDCDSDPVAHGSKSPSARPYPTPVTAASNAYRTPQGHRKQERRKAELASPILQPIDPNAQILPRTSEETPYRKRPVPPSRRDRGAAHVPALAEDGEDLFAMTPSRPAPKDGINAKQTNLKSAANKIAKAPDLHRRLGTLLTEPSPAKSVLRSKDFDLTGLFPPTKTPSSRLGHDATFQTLTTPLSVPFRRPNSKDQMDSRSVQSTLNGEANIPDLKNNSAQATVKRLTPEPVSRKILIPTNDPQDARLEDEPLRARPLHRLSIEDFKISPAYNDYTFREPIRTSDEKRAVGGCTDRHCDRCKDQLIFVEKSGYQTLRKPGESADEADQRILEAFVGFDTRRLEIMSNEERTKMLWQAKHKEFANQYGKHRQAFSRSREVPGLWDVDFPTTQKEKENREAALSIYREKLEERYFEALKPGGKYVFADEMK